jgi:hypothetical protein
MHINFWADNKVYATVSRLRLLRPNTQPSYNTLPCEVSHTICPTSLPSLPDAMLRHLQREHVSKP